MKVDLSFPSAPFVSLDAKNLISRVCYLYPGKSKISVHWFMVQKENVEEGKEMNGYHAKNKVEMGR